MNLGAHQGDSSQNQGNEDRDGSSGLELRRGSSSRSLTSSTRSPTHTGRPNLVGDPLHAIHGPMTRAKTKKMHEAFSRLIEEVRAQEESKNADYKPNFINVLSVI